MEVNYSLVSVMLEPHNETGCSNSPVTPFFLLQYKTETFENILKS